MKDRKTASPQDIFVKNNEIQIDSSSHSNIEPPFDISPKNFLKYAEYDLKTEYEHHLINSLSNIKRAIDCQFDYLFYGFGLLEKSNKEKWTFPVKMNKLNNLGVISPRILRNINRKRNLLEHDYVLPNKHDVEDALDVAILFNAYTEKFLLNALTECEFYHIIKPLAYEIKLDYKTKVISFFEQNRDTGKTNEETISVDSEDYLTYLKLLIKLYQFV